jgi:hypothetical protein
MVSSTGEAARAREAIEEVGLLTEEHSNGLRRSGETGAPFDTVLPLQDAPTA